MQLFCFVCFFFLFVSFSFSSSFFPYSNRQNGHTKKYIGWKWSSESILIRKGERKKIRQTGLDLICVLDLYGIVFSVVSCYLFTSNDIYEFDFIHIHVWWWGVGFSFQWRCRWGIRINRQFVEIDNHTRSSSIKRRSRNKMKKKQEEEEEEEEEKEDGRKIRAWHQRKMGK